MEPLLNFGGNIMNKQPSRGHVALAFVASVFLAAGCAGGGSNPVPQSAINQPGSLQSSAAARTPQTTTTPTPAPSGGTAPTCPQGYSCGYRAIETLSFDGANFTEVQSRWACFPNLWQLPIYTATSSGPLTLASAAVSLPATCTNLPFAKRDGKLLPFTTTATPTPSPVPTATPTTAPSASPNPSNRQLYIVSYRVGWGEHDRAIKGASVMHPNCDNAFGPIAIAGAANLTDNPWNFPVIPNALNLQTGQHYVFFVAEWVQIPHHHGWW
jgi:hypothetical protein